MQVRVRVPNKHFNDRLPNLPWRQGSLDDVREKLGCWAEVRDQGCNSMIAPIGKLRWRGVLEAWGNGNNNGQEPNESRYSELDVAIRYADRSYEMRTFYDFPRGEYGHFFTSRLEPGAVRQDGYVR